MKINKNIAIILLIIIIIGFLFYWCEWRPGQIRKQCSVIASSFVDESGKFKPGSIAAKYSAGTYFDEVAYKKCLTEKGLEK